MEVKIPDRFNFFKDLEEEERRRRLWLLTHMCGACVGFAIMVLLLQIAHIGAIDSTAAGMGGKAALDIFDFKIGA